MSRVLSLTISGVTLNPTMLIFLPARHKSSMRTHACRPDRYAKYNHSEKGKARMERYVISLHADPARHAHRLLVCKAYNMKRRILLGGEKYRNMKAAYEMRRRMRLKNKAQAAVYSALPASAWIGHGLTAAEKKRQQAAAAADAATSFSMF